MPTWMYLPLFFAIAIAIVLAVDLLDRHESRCRYCRNHPSGKHRGWS